MRHLWLVAAFSQEGMVRLVLDDRGLIRDHGSLRVSHLPLEESKRTKVE